MLLRNCPAWGAVAAIATLRLTDVTLPIRTNATGQPATVGGVVIVAVVVIVAEGPPKAREMAVPEPTTDMSASHMTTTEAPAEVAAAHAAAEVTSTTAVATSAGATCKRIGGNASASHSYRGNDDRDSVQRKCLHDCFLSD
jgi:hypothetical protein